MAGKTTSETKDILLSPDDRYDIWEVKRVERPHLINLENTKTDEYDDDSGGDGIADDDAIEDVAHNDNGQTINPRSLPLPLVDGADLKSWRCSKLVEISSFVQGQLNVGSGCALLRKESQLPVALSKRSQKRWRELQASLLEPPKSTAVRIGERDALGLPCYPWFERQNVPVILQGLAKNWKAMKTCTFDRLVTDFGDYQWRFSDTHGCGGSKVSLPIFKNCTYCGTYHILVRTGTN